MASLITFSCLAIDDTVANQVLSTFISFDLVVFVGLWALSFLRYDARLIAYNTLLLAVYATLYHAGETLGIVSVVAVPCNAIIQSYRYEFPNAVVVDTLARYFLVLGYYHQRRWLRPGVTGWPLLLAFPVGYAVALLVLQIQQPLALLVNLLTAAVVLFALDWLVRDHAGKTLRKIAWDMSSGLPVGSGA